MIRTYTIETQTPKSLCWHKDGSRAAVATEKGIQVIEIQTNHTQA